MKNWTQTGIFKGAGIVTFVTFLLQQLVWADPEVLRTFSAQDSAQAEIALAPQESVGPRNDEALTLEPAPSVVQLPEGLRPVPVTNPNSLIGDKPNLPDSQSTSLDFLADSETLSTGESVSIHLPPPPEVKAPQPVADKPVRFTGFSNSISLERQPGITTGNLKDLVTDMKPLRNPEAEIESLQFYKVSAISVFSKKVAKKGKIGKRNWHKRERKKRSRNESR